MESLLELSHFDIIYMFVRAAFIIIVILFIGISAMKKIPFKEALENYFTSTYKIILFSLFIGMTFYKYVLL